MTALPIARTPQKASHAPLPQPAIGGRRASRRERERRVWHVEVDVKDERTDAELLRESRRRPEAFVEVCARHAEVLQAWLARETRDAGVAGELVAETLAEAWRFRRRFRAPADGSARPWLFGIARNLLARYRRDGAVDARARERIGLRLEPARDDPFEIVDRRVTAEAERPRLAAAVAALPDDQREALALRVVAERDYDDIANELSISATTARTRVFRALRTLRARLAGGER